MHYKDLRVWQDAMVLAEVVYQLCGQLPREETYGLAGQLRRAAVSVPSNIAEGSARNNTKELIQFLFIARASLAEIETQILLAQRLYGLNSGKEFEELTDKLSRGLANLIKSLKTPHASRTTRHAPQG